MSATIQTLSNIIHEAAQKYETFFLKKKKKHLKKELLTSFVVITNSLQNGCQVIFKQ